jgi:ATP-dependent helicase HrpB
LKNDRSQRAKDGKALAVRWLKLAGGSGSEIDIESGGMLLALAYPDRVAQARGATGRFRSPMAAAPNCPQSMAWHQNHS